MSNMSYIVIGVVIVGVVLGMLFGGGEFAQWVNTPDIGNS